MEMSKRTCFLKALFVLLPLVVAGSSLSAVQSQPAGKEEHTVKTEAINAAKAKAHLESEVKTNKKTKKMQEHLQGKGFKPANGEKDFFAQKTNYIDAKGQDVQIEVYVQNFVKGKSKNKVAQGQVVVTKKGTPRTTYDFYLDAVDGDFQGNIEEYYIDDATNTVKKANSWWSCVKAKIQNKCSTTCVGALVTCIGAPDWSSYLLCVSLKCGSCWLKWTACCTCNCSWSCEWACGCCKR